MSSWKSETSSDLEEAVRGLRTLMEEISGEPSNAQLVSIWRAYVLVEKSIAFIRVEIDEENPGRFVAMGPYRVPDERQALHFALRNLESGSESFRLGDFGQAIKGLREGRNYLRVLLRQKRLSRFKVAGRRP